MNDESIKITAAKYFALLVIANFFDSLTEIMSNTLKGLRRINTAFFLSLGINCFCLFSLYLGHYYLGAEGIIYGYIISNVMYVIVLSTTLLIISWQQCIDDSARELHDDAAKLES